MAVSFEPIQKLLKGEAPVRWVFAGDSITHGALHTWGRRDYTEMFSERIRYEMNRQRDHVIKVGISGYTTHAVRNDIEWNILQFHPDVLFVMLGMNDARGGEEGLVGFDDHYRFIIGGVRRRGTEHVVLCTCNPIRGGDATAATWGRAMLSRYMDAVRALADKEELPLIDHYAYWESEFKRPDSRAVEWFADDIHPNAFGQAAMARTLMTALGIWDPQSFVGRTLIP